MDVWKTCYFFFCSGGGRGSPRCRAGGTGFLLKVPGGGVSRTGGAKGPAGCLRRIGGFFFLGGGQIFGFGAEMATKYCNSTHFELLAEEILANLGLRFWDRAPRDSVKDRSLQCGF